MLEKPLQMLNWCKALQTTMISKFHRNMIKSKELIAYVLFMFWGSKRVHIYKTLKIRPKIF